MFVKAVRNVMADHLKISFSRNQLNETVSDVENSPNRCLQLGEGDLSISGFPLIDGLFQCKETFCNFLLWHISIISILYRYYIQKKTDWLFTSSRLEWVYISCWAAQLGDEEPSTVIVSQVLLRAEWVAGMHMVVRYPSDLGHALFEAKCGRNDKCFIPYLAKHELLHCFSSIDWNMFSFALRRARMLLFWDPVFCYKNIHENFFQKSRYFLEII